MVLPEAEMSALGAKAGDDMTMVPEYNFYIAFDQDLDVRGHDANLRFEVAGYGETKSHFNVKDSDISPAYEVANLSGSIQVNENVRLGLYVENLFNEEVILYKRSRYRGDWSTGAQYYFYGDERTVSVRLDFNF